jgi:hypothetical protein
MIAKRGAMLFAIIVLSFIAAFLAADLATPGGFNLSESVASFFSLPKVQHSEPNCDCEYSSEFQSNVCNGFCGDLSDAFCNERADCII